MKRPSDEEASLFREAMRDVKRLGSDAQPASGRKPAARARVPKRTRVAVRAVSPSGGGPVTTPSFARQGTARTLIRELRRGRLRVQAELDLHGLTAARAAVALEDFLGEAVARGLTCIRIVHGKGLHSGPAGPVLRNLVEATLRQTVAVAAFAPAPPVTGGTGAVHVLLKRR